MQNETELRADALRHALNTHDKLGQRTEPADVLKTAALYLSFLQGRTSTAPTSAQATVEGAEAQPGEPDGATLTPARAFELAVN